MGTLGGHISMCKVPRTMSVTEQVLWGCQPHMDRIIVLEPLWEHGVLAIPDGTEGQKLKWLT